MNSGKGWGVVIALVSAGVMSEVLLQIHILRCELCQRDVPKPSPNKKITYGPDALHNFVEQLRSKHTANKLQTFTTLGGQTVAFSDKISHTIESSANTSSAT